MQLKVIKVDGGIEGYLHTKVLGTISKALADIGEMDIYTAEELAEAVTYFLYHKKAQPNITSSEILSVIKVVLSVTGYEDAAEALSEHHFERKLKRSRIQVASATISDLTDTELFCGEEQFGEISGWDKSRITADLVSSYGVSPQVARAIASMVEEKIFKLEINQVSAGLIKELVLGDTAMILRAERQMQMV